MLKLVLIGVSVAGLSLAATAGTADARDGRSGASRGKAVYAASARKRSVRTTRQRTTRVARGPELMDNTKYWHHNTPLDGKAMFDAINDQSTNDGH
jgi:hypothetical protein